MAPKKRNPGAGDAGARNNDLAGASINSECNHRHHRNQAEIREFEIYSGLRILGVIRGERDKWEAFDAEFRALGIFTSEEKAVAAIYEAADPKVREARQ